MLVLHFQHCFHGAAFNMLGQAYPGLGERQPQRLVLIIFGALRHRDTFFGVAAVIERRPHDNPPGEPNDAAISLEDYGDGGIMRGRNSGEAR
jgi:hypothetical protein